MPGRRVLTVSGTSLMAQASRESNAPISTPDETSMALTRQLYIHGMTYLLRGLPMELTLEETLTLHAALPDALEMGTTPDASALLEVSQRNPSPPKTHSEDATILHRITATLVFQTFIFIQCLLPYITLFLSHTYQFERKHQITKRLVNSGVTTVDELGRKSLRFSQTICQMNNGMVGQAINEMTMWFVTGLTGGFAEGLQAIRVEPSKRAETVES
jgi:hypothetical protein